MYVLLIIFSAFLFILIVPCTYLAHRIIHPRTISVEETIQQECGAGKFCREKFEQLPKEEVYITSPYGYRLFGYFIPAGDSKKAIIFCHGITYTLYGSVKYVDSFLQKGFNILLYDHRNHGRSGGKNTTFGFCEKQDLKAVTDWLVSRLGPGCTIGVHGESMGAATLLQNAAIDPRIAFFIADCPYSDLMTLFKYHIRRDFHLPAFPFVHLCSLINKLWTGTFYSQISPIKEIGKVQTPVFFIHGQEDAYIPKEMSMEMHHHKQGMKKLYLAPNAGHTEAFWNNREEYVRLVEEFLVEIGAL